MKKVILILLMSLTSCSTYETYITNNYYPVIKTDATPEEKELVRLINEYRASLNDADIKPLIHEVLASQVCENRNYQDIQQGLFPSHIGWSNMLIDAMVEPNNGSHLVGYNYVNAQELFNAYLSSESHKKGLEMENATHIGTSIVNRRNYTLIIKY